MGLAATGKPKLQRLVDCRLKAHVTFYENVLDLFFKLWLPANRRLAQPGQKYISFHFKALRAN